MTDEPVPEIPVAGEPEARARVESTPVKRRWDALPVLYLIGFVVLGGALFYLYRHPAAPSDVAPSSQVTTLQDQLQALNGRIAQLEQRPAAGAPDLGPLQARLDQLERRAAAPGPVPPELATLPARVGSLEARPAPADLTSRVERLESRPVTPPVDLGPLGGRVDAVTKQVGDLGGKLGDVASKMAEVGGKIGALEPRLAAVETASKQTQAALAGVAERAQRAGRLQAAAAALQGGQPLGEIPNAPPALAQYAHQAPPTEASLRLSFDEYAQAAQRVSTVTTDEQKPFASRLWSRAQQVVTVRQGDKVLLGDPIAGVLAHAREALDAGDLPGSVKALEGLAGPPAEAMAPWIAQARGLLDARAALASMAAG